MHSFRIDDVARSRLTARYGAEVEPWFDELPAVLGALVERWQVELDSIIPRGSMSVVIRCRMSDGRPAVLTQTKARRERPESLAPLLSQPG